MSGTGEVAAAEAFVDEESLGSFLADRRWFGARSRELTSVGVRDTAVVHEAPELLAVLLADAYFDNGERRMYQLLVGSDRADLDGTAGAGLRSAAGQPVHDVESAPELALALTRAAIAGTVTPAANGSVEFRTITPLELPAQTEARLLDAEQSNTSIVLDQLLLKVYRHIEAGLNPELELLLFLTEHGFDHIAELVGWYGYTGEELSATLGIFQRFLADAVDGWELALRELPARPDAFAATARTMGGVVGAMHATLASDPSEPSFAPEDPGPEYLGLVAASAEEDLDAVFAKLADEESAEPIRGRADEIRDRLRVLAQGTSPGRLIRTHGDLHLGQLLLAGGRWHVLDFEGEPARSLVERRRKQIPLRDVAGMLRSISYATATLAANGTPPPDGCEADVRDAFLEGYRSVAEAGGILAPSGASQDRLLQFFELDKAIYELRYELDHRPDWLHVPATGIADLLARELP